MAIVDLVNLAANLGMAGESEVALPALVHGPLHAGATAYGTVLAAFGVFPLSVAVAAVVVRHWGPTPFFLIAAATLAVAIVAGLSQRAWREFGANQPAPTPEPANHLEGQPA